jgi:O-antigen ligase
MLKTYKFLDMPFTYIFLLFGALFTIKEILVDKFSKIEIYLYLLLLYFSFISLTDVAFFQLIDINHVLKLIFLIVSIKLYSFFIIKFGFDSFLKILIISSTIILIYFLYRSIFILHSPFFSINYDFITEAGKNQVAYYLALLTPCTLWYLLNLNKRTFVKLFILFSLIIHLFAGIYTQSKGYVIIMIISLFLTLLYTRRFRLTFKRFAIGLLLTIFIGILFNFFDFINLYNFYFELISLFDNRLNYSYSNNIRINLIYKSILALNENPLFGIGTNQFVERFKYATHNNLLQVLSENGLIGFFIFLSLLFFILKDFLKYKSLDFKFCLSINLLLTIFIYLFVINGFFTSITMFVLSFIIAYQKNINNEI